MLSLLYRVFVRVVMALSSFSVVIMFYVFVAPFSFDFSRTLEYIIRLAAPILAVLFLAWLSLFLVKHDTRRSDTMAIEHFRQLEGTAIPTYIGLSVISLGLGSLDCVTAIVVLLSLFVLWKCSERNTYFNPAWLFMGYNFYEVQTKHGNNLTLIAHHANLKTSEVVVGQLIRINEYTYMEA